MTQALATQQCTSNKEHLDVLSGPQLEEYREQLGYGWQVVNDRLEKTYKFDNYEEGVEFTKRVTGLAQEQDHHPDILLSYGKVTITLTTHKMGGITQNDFILAAKIEKAPKEVC